MFPDRPEAGPYILCSINRNLIFKSKEREAH